LAVRFKGSADFGWAAAMHDNARGGDRVRTRDRRYWPRDGA
jgi:hypothetical protein